MVGCQTLKEAQVVPRTIIQSVATEEEGISLFLGAEKAVGHETEGQSAMLGRYILTPDIFEILRRVQPNSSLQLFEQINIA